MADFRHPHCPLIRGGLPRHQLIFEVNFDHFTHQAIGSAHGGNLLQNGETGSPDSVARSRASTRPECGGRGSEYVFIFG